MPDLKFHPAADAFPMMDDGRYAELLEDIRKHGQRELITLCDGMVLDGRNRYRACQELMVEPQTRDYDDNPWDYVWSLNGQRRDLVEEQRYLIWKFCHEQGEGWQNEQGRIREEGNQARSEAMKGVPYAGKGKVRKSEKVVGHNAQLLSGGRDKARQAKAKASGTGAAAVKRGDTLAAKRPDLAEKTRTGQLKPAEAHRQMKKDEVSGKMQPFPSDRFRVLYVDPPWAYSDKLSGSISFSYGGAEKHYPCMSLSDLKALPIIDISADDSVLFMWVTVPLLPDGLDLMKAWGFTYKTHFIWDKIKHNMGHYSSVRHEVLLLGTRGSCTPDNVKLFDSVQSIERTEHSEKPKEFRRIIETLYPNGLRIELFSRGQVDGWTCWGNEVAGT